MVSQSRPQALNQNRPISRMLVVVIEQVAIFVFQRQDLIGRKCNAPHWFFKR